MSTLRIREARPSDAPDIAFVHVTGWRTTYAGIMPEHYLATLSYASRERYWSMTLRDSARRETIFVAEDDAGRVVAFVSGGPNRERDPGYGGELYAIYLLPQHRRQGIGTALVHALACRLKDMHLHAMLVWVLADNPYRGFYEGLGGQLVRSKTVTIGGLDLDEVAYGWPDMRALVPDTAL